MTYEYVHFYGIKVSRYLWNPTEDTRAKSQAPCNSSSEPANQTLLLQRANATLAHTP